MNRNMLVAAATLCVGLSACATPSVEEVNAKNAKTEASCEAKGYKKGTKDFDTCLMLAAQSQMNDAMMNGALGGTAAYAIMVPMMMMSDVRVKRDIEKVGEENGFNLYRFKYVRGEEEYIGVLAQEVASTRPDAVALDPNGYLRVNYERIGVTFRRAPLRTRVYAE